MVALEASKLAAKNKIDAEESSDDEEFEGEERVGEESSASESESDEEGEGEEGGGKTATAGGEEAKRKPRKRKREEGIDKAELLGLHADAADILGPSSSSGVGGGGGGGGGGAGSGLAGAEGGKKASKKKQRNPEEEAAHKASMDALFESLQKEDRGALVKKGHHHHLHAHTQHPPPITTTAATPAAAALGLLTRLNGLTGRGDATVPLITGASTVGIAKGEATSVDALVASSYGGGGVGKGVGGKGREQWRSAPSSFIPGLSAFASGGGGAGEGGGEGSKPGIRSTGGSLGDLVVDKAQLLAIAAAARIVAGGSKVAVQETVKFAGKNMTVTKMVDRSSLKAGGAPQSTTTSSSSSSSSSSSAAAAAAAAASGAAGAAGGGGLSAALNAMAAPESISTLAKTSLDWDGYKAKEGLSEDFTSAARSGGVVEKAALLARLDERSYAVEAGARAAEQRAKNIQAAAGRI